MRRRILQIALAGAVTGVLVYSPAAASAANPLLPDLGMAPLSDFRVDTVGVQKQLRFSATIVNVGAGAFELDARRESVDHPWQVTQRVFDSDGGSQQVATASAVPLVFGADGHAHWHVKDLERYELRRLDNGVKVGTAAKSGFCFFDSTPHNLSLPGATDGYYGWEQWACGEDQPLADRPNITSFLMGLSVGWGDKYHANLPDQFIDISGLANGKYRLVATADPLGRFAEIGNANNGTWVDLSISAKRGQTSVKVLRYGPSS